MPTYNDLVKVARTLKQRIDGKAFESLPRREVTDLLREISGEETTRIKPAMGEQLDMALLEQGVRAYPRFRDTSTEDTMRIFHPHSVVADLVDIIARPDAATDKELGEILLKLKGKWNWNHGETHIKTSTESMFQPVTIRGEPLSDTVLRERR